MSHQRSAWSNGSSSLQYILLGGWLVLFAANFILHDLRGLGGGGDSFGYLVPATNLVEGFGYTYRGRPELVFPPGYGLSTLPLYLAGFELIQAALITNVIALALACLFMYLICRFYVSRLFALVAILFVITNTYIMDLTAVAMSEATFMAAISGAGYFVLRFIRQPKRNPLNLAVAGAFAGWAALTRPEGMGIALALLGFLWIDLLLRQPPPRFRPRFAARLALYGMIFAAPATVIYGPYVAFLSKNLGHFALSAKSNMNIEIGNAELHNQTIYLPLDPSFSPQRVHTTLRDDVVRTGRNLIFYTRQAIKQNFALLFSLCLVLAIGVWRNKFRISPVRAQGSADLWEALGFCVCMLSPVIPIAYYMARARLLVPYDPFVIIGAIVLMDRIVAVRSSAGWQIDRRLFAVTVAAPLVLLGTCLNVAKCLVVAPDHPLQTAAIALASLAQARPVNVMTVRAAGMVTYYANDRRIPVAAHFELIAPEDTPDTVIETMQAKGVQYLVLDRSYIQRRPKVSSLWTCPPDACLQRVRLVAEKPDSYRIFELMPEGDQAAGMAN